MIKSIQISPTFAKGLAIGATLFIFGVDWWTPTLINISIFYSCVIVMLAPPGQTPDSARTAKAPRTNARQPSARA